MKAAPKVAGAPKTAAETRGAEYRAKADEISRRLYHLGNIAHLAAFAAQARDTLEQIDRLTNGVPHVAELINNCVTNPGDWAEKKDVSGEVLTWLADQMSGLDTEMIDAMYAMAKGDEVSA